MMTMIKFFFSLHLTSTQQQKFIYVSFYSKSIRNQIKYSISGPFSFSLSLLFLSFVLFFLSLIERINLLTKSNGLLSSSCFKKYRSCNKSNNYRQRNRQKIRVHNDSLTIMGPIYLTIDTISKFFILSFV